VAEGSVSERIGDWMQTYTGRQFWPLDPRPEEVDIEDIARSLAHQCRYAGHVRRHYSVAEHSFHIAAAVPPEAALWGLLHDATEAYLVDVPRPVKAALGEVYARIERRLEACIAARFGLALPVPPCVKAADTRILQMERAALLEPPPVPWATDAAGPPLLGIRIWAWPADRAYDLFMHRFRQLTGG